MTTPQIVPVQQPVLREFPGGYLRFLVSPDQTGGTFALVEYTQIKGTEPPRHIHTLEDETFYVLDGIVRFEIGDTVITGGAGQAAFAPRNVGHQYILQTEQASILTLITPGNFVNYMIETSQPIDEIPTQLQAPQGPPPPEVIAQVLKRLGDHYQVHFA